MILFYELEVRKSGTISAAMIDDGDWAGGHAAFI